MKRCPKCSQLFDKSYGFCLEDGTRLTDQIVSEEGEGFSSSAEVPTQFISRPPAVMPASINDSSKWFYLIVGLLTALVIVGGIIIIFRPFRGDKANKTQNETVRTLDPPSNLSTPLPVNKSNSPVTVPPTQTPIPSRPPSSTVRMRFAKGAITSTTSGSLSPAQVRTYVLACRAGQQLNATISSSNGCIVFIDNSTVFRSVTRKGDNSISVKNSCSGVGSYRFDITII